jgi:NAD(P)-dependent dehydrogenase (short-subunit alcohol dehydrogenase family)
MAGAGIEDQVRMILFRFRHVCSIRIFEQFTKDTALGHIGLPTDVAALVSYLASKESHLITGQSVSIFVPYLSIPFG